MVLLNLIIQVATRAYLDVPSAAIFLDQQSQASVGRLIPVEVDLARPGDSFPGGR
jgi:hypothetical protein